MLPADETEGPDDYRPLHEPMPRQSTDPDVRFWRAPTMSIRRASGMSLWARVERQTERDALLHRLGRIDDELAALSAERRAIVDELTVIREELYPPVPWCHGRRPPDLDCAPLPPAPRHSTGVAGRWLRNACLAILRRHGPTSLRELHGLLHRYGYVIHAARPVTALSDAMAYEVERGRARRVGRGVYEAAPQLTPSTARHRSDLVDLVDLPEPWIATQPARLDPSLDEDPLTWRPAS